LHATNTAFMPLNHSHNTTRKLFNKLPTSLTRVGTNNAATGAVLVKPRLAVPNFGSVECSHICRHTCVGRTQCWTRPQYVCAPCRTSAVHTASDNLLHHGFGNHMQQLTHGLDAHPPFKSSSEHCCNMPRTMVSFRAYLQETWLKRAAACGQLPADSWQPRPHCFSH
jgi:hypothetical protein